VGAREILEQIARGLEAERGGGILRTLRKYDRLLEA
jgi:hypothetical protein